MKNTKYLVFSIIMTASLIFICSCSNFISIFSPSENNKSGVVYEVSEDGTYAIVSSYTGLDKEVVISDTYNNLPVTQIKAYAFYSSLSLYKFTKVVIPDSVTYIGEGAFANCKNLSNVVMSDNIIHIDRHAFRDTAYYNNESNWKNNVLYIGNHLIEAKENISDEYAIQDGTITIAAYAFSNCESLIRVVIPDSVTSIGDYAFMNCTNFTGVSLPDNLTSINAGTFFFCFRLTEIVIPDNITSIGDLAFYNCSSLTRVVIPSSIDSIGDEAFRGCENLNVYISDIGSWCNISFYDEMSNPLHEAQNLYLNDKLITELAIPESVSSIGKFAFFGYANLTSISISNSVTSIGDSAFSNCSSLTSITIPDSVTSIGNSAFEDTAYYNDSNHWEKDGLYINNHLIKAIAYSSEYVIRNGTITIADYAFYNCDNLVSIFIPNSVNTIGNCAFFYCDNLTSIAIPNSVTSIGSSAFSDCTSLTRLTIPNSVVSIGFAAFARCDSLTSVVIGNGVTNIESGAFYKCDKLKDVYYTGSQKDWAKIKIDNSYNYNNILYNVTIHYNYVPEE